MTVKEIYDNHCEYARNFEREIATIKDAKGIYTIEEINRQIEEKTNAFYSSAATTGEEIAKHFNDFRKNKNYNSVAIDNPAFTGLLQAVQVFGKNIPSTLLDTAVYKLKNEQGTLAALKGLFKEKEIFYPAIDNLIIENDLIDAAIIEASKYNKEKPLIFGNVNALIDGMERLENYNLPEYQTEIPKMKTFF